MKKPYLLAGISIFIWSTVPVMAKLMLKSLTSIQIVSVSSMFAAAALIVTAFFTGKIKLLKNYRLKDYLITILIGIPGTFLYYVFLYLGTDRMLPSQAFIINYLWPVMSIVCACIILREKLSARGWIAVLMSFAGVIIVTGDNLIHFDQNTVTGAFFCILGAISYGLFTALNKKFTYDKTLSMMISYSATFVFSTAFILISGNTFTLDFGQWCGMVWNGVFSYALGTTCWTLALNSGSTSKISNLAYITPFLALIWSALVPQLNDPLKLRSWIGLTVIVAGILLQLLPKKENKKLA